MITALYRTPVRASMSARLGGVSIWVSGPALTASPAGEPCVVRIRNRTSFSASIPLAAVCKDVAKVSIVAFPPFFELYCTSTGPWPKRSATIFAAPVASLRKTLWSPKSPTDTTLTLRASSTACAGKTDGTTIKTKATSGTPNRLTKLSNVLDVMTNLVS